MLNRFAATSLAVMAVVGTAQATEGGGSIYPHGTENYMVGALPPPGVYGLLYANDYTADRTNDANGNAIPVPGFKVHATALAPRIVWVPGAKVMGGDLAVHMIAPLVNLKVSAAGQSQSQSGLGDMTVGVGVGFHHSPQLHSSAGLDLILPTGGYTLGNLANIGRNYSAIEPVYAVSYIDPYGFNGDLRVGYLINQKNKDTDYKSGQEFHFDYAAGWGLGNGWTLGLGGYYRQQVTQDQKAGVELANSKSSGLALGPSVKYDSGKGWFVTAKWQVERNVKNSTQGQAIWLKAVFPL